MAAAAAAVVVTQSTSCELVLRKMKQVRSLSRKTIPHRKRRSLGFIQVFICVFIWRTCTRLNLPDRCIPIFFSFMPFTAILTPSPSVLDIMWSYCSDTWHMTPRRPVTADVTFPTRGAINKSSGAVDCCCCCCSNKQLNQFVRMNYERLQPEPV